jgi:uncharacterized protein
MGIAHLARAQVRLWLVAGSPATGKTTLAGAVADRVGGVLLSSDRVRKETFGLDPTQRHGTHYRRGIYTREATKQKYWHLAERAGSALTMGKCVVVDASFSTTAHRQVLRDTADRSRARLVEVRCQPPHGVVAAGLRLRSTSPDLYTDAGPSVGERLAHDSDPSPEAHVIDTSEALSASVTGVCDLWEPEWCQPGRRV